MERDKVVEQRAEGDFSQFVQETLPRMFHIVERNTTAE